MRHHQNWKTWNTRTINTWARSFSFAEGVGNVCSQRIILNGSIQNKCIGVEKVHDFVDESRHPSWTELCIEFGDLQENKIRGDWECVQHYSKVGNGTFWRNSECDMLGAFITFLGEMDICQRSSQNVGEGKNLCVLCWFRFVCWTDERHSRSNKKWKDQVEGLTGCFRLTKMQWVSMEVHLNSSGKNFPGSSSLFSSRKYNKTWRERTSSQRSSRTGSSSCQCSMTFEWTTNDENCISNSEEVRNYAMRFLQGHRTFLGPGSEEKWYGSSSHAQKRQWNCTAENGATIQRNWSFCVQNISALSRGILKNIHSFHRRFVEHRILVPNESFRFFSSVFTEQWRIGNIKSVRHFCAESRFWPSWNRKKYNSWYLFRHKQLETGCDKKFWASKHWKRRHGLHN